MGYIRKDVPAFLCTWGQRTEEFGVAICDAANGESLMSLTMTPDELIHLANEMIDLANMKSGSASPVRLGVDGENCIPANS